MVLNNIVFSLIGPRNFTKSGSYDDTGIFPELFDDPNQGKIYHGTVQLILIDDYATREIFFREVTFLYRNTIVQQIPISPNVWKDLPNMRFDRIEIRSGHDVLNQPLNDIPAGRFEFNFDGDMLSAPETVYNYTSKTSINNSLPALVSISGRFIQYGGGNVDFYNYDWENDVVGSLEFSVANLDLPDAEFFVNNVYSNKAYIAKINGEPTLVNGDKFFFTNLENSDLDISLAPDENFQPFDLPPANDELTENVNVQADLSSYRQGELQVFSIDNITGNETFVVQSTPEAATIFTFSLAPNVAYVFRYRAKKLSVGENTYVFTNQESMNVNLSA